MPGNRQGGLKAAAANKANNPNFYREIALKAQESWKKNGRKPRGFASSVVGKDGLTGLQRARKAGVLGGTISRRKPTTIKITVTDASPEAVDISMAATEAATL